MRVRKLAEVAPALLVSGYLLARVLGVAQAPQTGTGGAIDHGGLAGLGDDDHDQYLKDKANGGTAGEVPLHDHSSGAQAGTIDHGSLTGLGDDDHPQYTTAAEATTIAGAAVTAHEAAVDPHPTYTTGAEVAAAILAALSAADGAALIDNGAGVLSVNVDGTTIEIAADALQVKAGGITIAHLAFDPATQAELDVVSAALAAHIADATAAHAASAIEVTPFATIAATTVQAALEEIVAEMGGGAPSGPAGGALDGTYPNPGLNSTVAGAGLAEAADVLSVVVDDTTIEINADTLRVKADGIGSSHIAAGAVGSSEIGTNAVGSDELADNAVDTNAIQDDAVTQAKIADNAVGTAQLLDDAVTGAELADESVTVAHIDSEAQPAGKVPKSDGAGGATWEDDETGGGGGSGESLVVSVNQVAHPFAVGDVVRVSDAGTSYVLAQADSVANAEVAGIVTEDTDADNFKLTVGGLVEGLTGLTAGAVHFLSASSAGDLTATEPTTTGDISKPVLIALPSSTTSGLFFNMRGALIGDEAAETTLDLFNYLIAR